jgi:Activator of Hsp90 ATPase homolog 1-like protein
MQKINLKTFIKASPEKVWDTMLSDQTYREWTKAFHAGSYYKGDWNEGSKILFVGPGEDGSEMGMVSRIAESRKPEFVSIEHLGIYKNGLEDTTSDEAKKWVPAHENYTFIGKDGGTELLVDMDIAESEKAMMEEMWAKALILLTEIAER